MATLVGGRRFREVVRNGETPVDPGIGTKVVSQDDVIAALYGNGTTVPYASGSTIYAANESQPLRLINQSRDWAKGAAMHAGPRPDNGYSGAPWDWGGVSGYKDHNAWYEGIAGGSVIPLGVRLHISDVRSYRVNSALTTVTETRKNTTGFGGGFWTNDPLYRLHDPDTLHPEGYDLVKGTDWRTEAAADGGGWSVLLDKMRAADGSVDANKSIVHGALPGWTGASRISLANGERAIISGWARLISDTLTQAQLDAVDFTMSLSMDIFTGPTDGTSPVNTSMVLPSHKSLSSSWRWVGVAALSKAQIQGLTLPFVNA